MDDLQKHSLLTGCLCALGCESLYGLSYVFTKLATSAGADGSALLAWRFFAGFIAVSACAAAGLMRVSFRGRSLRPLLLVALCYPVVYFIAETAGIRLTTASESGVFLACIPVVALIASSLILRERPSRAQRTGIAVTLCGALVTVFAARGSATFSPAGYAALTAAVVSYALYCVAVRKTRGFTDAEITFAMMAAGTAVFGAAALVKALRTAAVRELLTFPLRDWRFAASTFFQGLGSGALAFFLNNAAIARIGVNRCASFIGVSTVVSILVGAAFLGERLSVPQLAGAAAIIAGVMIANLGN